MKPKKNLLVVSFILFTYLGFPQVVNMNTDPNGEPWWSGGVPKMTPALQYEYDQLPRMILKSTIDPPYMVDNSQLQYMRPVFLQEGGSCAQASGIGYVFTYETNCKRNLPADTSLYSENWYTPYFTYNYLNDGSDTNGTTVTAGWDIVKENGCPSYPGYGGGSGGFVNDTYWMTGYGKYDSALANRIDSSAVIDISENPEYGLQLLKQWIFTTMKMTKNMEGWQAFQPI